MALIGGRITQDGLELNAEEALKLSHRIGRLERLADSLTDTSLALEKLAVSLQAVLETLEPHLDIAESLEESYQNMLKDRPEKLAELNEHVTASKSRRRAAKLPAADSGVYGQSNEE